MNKGMLTVGIILLSIIALILINVLTNYSTGSEYSSAASFFTEICLADKYLLM